ncbi:MAG: peptidase M3, partial [Bacteroidales bacterium]|nr:peptidase M3 [Bacteroidales bacterium]
MKKNITLLTALTLLFMVSSCKKESEKAQTNPLLAEWTTEFGVPPFDQIKTEHYIPAFEEAMKMQKAEIDAIVNNSEAPTFANTIEALEESGSMLSRVESIFFNLAECVNSEEMENISEEILPKLSQHGDDISLNAKLFERVKAVYDQRESMNLDAIQMRLLEETYKDFVRGGANVPAEKQARFREINEKLSLLTMQFGNNVLKATNSYKLVVDDAARLEGCTEGQLAAALELGNESEETKGKYVFTIHLPSMEPFLMNCKDRELRKELWTAYSTRCTSGDTDNSGIINEIVNLRLERANILGYKSHADYVLDNNMAKTPEAVNNLLMQVWTPALAKAKEEAAEYQKMIDAEGGNFKLEPCDWRYYCETLRKQKYDLNDDIIRPYFPLENVKDGIFMVANKLYGIEFRENKNIPVYHPEAVAYEVVENNEV